MARYRATQDGNLNNVVQIERGGKHTAGTHILKGDVFEYDGVQGSWMEAVSEEPEAASEPDREAIKAQLEAAGIKYFKGASTEKLLSLLPKGE